MHIIEQSAAHHFLALLEKMKTAPAGWVGIHCAFSRAMTHDSLMESVESLLAQMELARLESAALSETLRAKAGGFANAILYCFSDHDLLLVARPADEQAQDSFYALFKALSLARSVGLVDFVPLGRDMIGAQKIAERKLLAERRIEAYHTIADINRTASIALRRMRRDHALVMIVEDDRFTTAYATNLLAKQYDIIHARTGEDCVIDYIAHAPDIVLLDIHLPGLDGLQTLRALRLADPSAHVVMLSVDTVKTNIDAATECGAAGFLRKPFSRDRVLALVEKCPYIKGPKIPANKT